MKKTLVSALTTAIVVGAASTTFAAANPFSDVPADHWAYDAVAQLAQDGVIEGYGDTTFQGDKNITRYEMAQMVAKAMAKTDVSAADKAMIDKLAAEFADELNNLGVRVSNLERNADMVKWNGKAEYTYTSERWNDNDESGKTNNDNLLFRLEPSAEVNDHWHVNARLDANTNLAKDEGVDESNVKLKRVWAQGDYKNFQTKIGKQEFYTNETGLIWDTNFSGATVALGPGVQGKGFKATVMAGRTDDNDKYSFLDEDDYKDFSVEEQEKAGLSLVNHKVRYEDDTSMQGINLDYATDKFNVGLGYYHLNSDTLRIFDKNLNSDKANLYSISAGYTFSPKARLWASYAKNNDVEVDVADHAWQTEFDYGTYNNAENKGSWSVYAAYRYMGVGASLCGTYDDIMQGTKGWAIGAKWAPFKNIGAIVKYGDGSEIDGNTDTKKLFGRIEVFF